MSKDYYTFKEIDDIELQLIETVGVDALYTAIHKWMGYEKLENFLRDYCSDHDIQVDDDDEEVGENEE